MSQEGEAREPPPALRELLTLPRSSHETRTIGQTGMIWLVQRMLVCLVEFVEHPCVNFFDVEFKHFWVLFFGDVEE